MAARFVCAVSPAPSHVPPARASCFVFNGDFVDRGAWGVELLTLVLAWKCALPSSVVVLRSFLSGVRWSASRRIFSSSSWRSFS